LRKNRAIGGTGLGLAITKLLLGMMGGSIEFSSEYESGSVFTAYFPFVEGDPQKITHSIIVDAVIARDVLALVVDDNSVNLTVAQGYLNTHNIFPDTAKSGMEAIAMVQQKDYDVVFMDHMMPVMDGIETTKHIRALPDERFKKLPIIALTANAVSGVKEMALEAGMNDFISKPIEASELNEVLVSWLPSEKIEIRRESAPSLHPVPQYGRDVAKPWTRTQQARIWQASIQRSGNGARSTEAKVEASAEEQAVLDKLRAIDGVDVKMGLLHLGGKPASYFKTIRRFCEEFPNYRATLETASASGQWNDYMIQAHSMKSSCAALGFRKISEWAARLESASKENRVEICLNDTPLFCQQAQVLYDALEDALKM
jgi:CheY-like chemotaxis protein